MASKIVVFSLIVAICKVQSHAIHGYPNVGATNVKTQSAANAQPVATSQGSGAQLATNTQTCQTQTLPVQSSGGNTGITASPRLQIIPGQGNVQAIPLSQLAGLLQQRGLAQNCGCIGGRAQGNQTPQIPLTPVHVTSPSLGIQPSLCGPSSVITAPVSAITIPPTGATTIIDNSMSNSLLNALQMLIANEFLNSAVNSNIINQGSIQIPVVETVVPGVDLGSLCQNSNAQPGQTTGQDNQGSYDWATIQNFLSQQNEQTVNAQTAQPQPQVSQQVESTSPDIAGIINYLTHNAKTAEQVANQPTQSQSYQQTCSCGEVPNGVLEALAAYLGCSTSEVSSNSYPRVPEIHIPDEIPAQLICNYGYMPTTVPVVSFSVKPLDCSDTFIVGSQC